MAPLLFTRRPLAERLAEKIDSTGGDNACHPWTGAKSLKRRGLRGVIHVVEDGRNRTIIATRVVLALSPQSEGHDWNCTLEVLHSCHNGGNEVDCHNWRHLRWGTRQENEDDKKAKPKGVAIADDVATLNLAEEATGRTGDDPPC